MIDYAIYGKIIIDNIRLLDGTVVEEELGGGGPQGAFGARLWSDSVGLITRVGSVFPAKAKERLDMLNVNLDALCTYPDLETLYGNMYYDENDYIDWSSLQNVKRKNRLHDAMNAILARDIKLPDNYKHPRVFHLITEYAHEDMMKQAQEICAQGGILSLEPLIDYREWSNKDEMIEFLPQAEVLSPDWPSASGFAGSDDPLSVLKWWSKRGSHCVSVRNGKQGSYVWDSNTDKMWHIPIINVPRVDPTGCGNSYGGSFCVGWDTHHDAKIAGAMGTVAATFMVQTAGLPRWNSTMRDQGKKMLEELLDSVRAM